MRQTEPAHVSSSTVQKKNPTGGTAGCLNLPENRVAALQKFTKKHPTVLAQIPQNQRLAG
jgi:hypothetical protein